MFDYSASQLDFAAKNLTRGFSEALCMLCTATSDEVFQQLAPAVDGIGEKDLTNPGLNQQVLQVINLNGNSSVAASMQHASEAVASSAK